MSARLAAREPVADRFKTPRHYSRTGGIHPVVAVDPSVLTDLASVVVDLDLAT
jgi:hypothetical protein